MKRIAVVEDEIFIREELEDIFQKAGYEVLCITDFCGAAKLIRRYEPDLVLLDLNLPGKSGFDICLELKEHSGIPVLVLTSRTHLDDEVRALRLGADEYLTKPCRKERLLARAENLLRRFEGREHMIHMDGMALDSHTYTLYASGSSMLLPENQGKIMEALLKRGGETVTKEELSRILWGTTEYIDENALQVNMTRLKKSLARLSLAEKIQTVRGVGYRIGRGDKDDRENVDDRGKTDG